MEAAHKKAKRFAHVPEMSSLGKILEPKTLQRGHTHPRLRGVRWGPEGGARAKRRQSARGWGGGLERISLGKRRERVGVSKNTARTDGGGGELMPTERWREKG